MNLQYLKEKLKAANLHPIHLEGSPLERSRGSAFIGNIEEYIDAAHALGVTAVFILTETLEAESFQYELDNEGEESDIEPAAIDLCKFNAKVEKYKEFLGQVGMFKLSISAHEDHVNFYINEDWWLEFIELWSETTERIEGDQEAAHAQIRAAQEQKDKQVLKKLSGLIRDADFVRLPTQRSMIEYAKDKIPELESVDAATLKVEIQSLHAKIKAKVLGNK